MVGDGEARKRAPAGLGKNESDMVVGIFSLPDKPHFIQLRHSISISDKPRCGHSVKFRLFCSKICAKFTVFAPILRSLIF